MFKSKIFLFFTLLLLVGCTVSYVAIKKSENVKVSTDANADSSLDSDTGIKVGQKKDSIKNKD